MALPALDDRYKHIAKMKPSNIAGLIHRLEDKAEGRLRVKINEWLEAMRREINRAFSTKYAKDEAAEIVAELVDWEIIENNAQVTIKPAMLNIMQRSGDQAFKIAGIEASFDVLNLYTVTQAQKICAKLVREVTANTKNAIKYTIREGIKQGQGIPQIAREIRPLVGLTERQVRSIANFEERLLINRPELSQVQINRRVGVYERRLHRERATTIARTETSRAVDTGTIIGYKDAGLKEWEWLAASDCCDECDANNGKRYSVDEMGILPAHPRCRCCPIPVIAA